MTRRSFAGPPRAGSQWSAWAVLVHDLGACDRGWRRAFEQAGAGREESNTPQPLSCERLSTDQRPRYGRLAPGLTHNPRLCPEGTREDKETDTGRRYERRERVSKINLSGAAPLSLYALSESGQRLAKALSPLVRFDARIRRKQAS